jgi:hypothetical protein
MLLPPAGPSGRRIADAVCYLIPVAYCAGSNRVLIRQHLPSLVNPAERAAGGGSMPRAARRLPATWLAASSLSSAARRGGVAVPACALTQNESCRVVCRPRPLCNAHRAAGPARPRSTPRPTPRNPPPHPHRAVRRSRSSLSSPLARSPRLPPSPGPSHFKFKFACRRRRRARALGRSGACVCVCAGAVTYPTLWPARR